MNSFVPKEKMSKKARKKMAAEKRTLWAFSPVTKMIGNKKTYNRKRISRTRYDDGREILYVLYDVCFTAWNPPVRGWTGR